MRTDRNSFYQYGSYEADPFSFRHWAWPEISEEGLIYKEEISIKESGIKNNPYSSFRKAIKEHK